MRALEAEELEADAAFWSQAAFQVDDVEKEFTETDSACCDTSPCGCDGAADPLPALALLPASLAAVAVAAPCIACSIHRYSRHGL